MKEMKLPKLRSKATLLAVGLTGAFLIVAVRLIGPAHVLSFEPAPTGYDPLTATEIDTVVAVALRAASDVIPSAAAASAPEVLLVERHEASKAEYASGQWPRQGDVYHYDYATDTLIHTVVDVASGAVTSVERVQGVQLPLSAGEKARALDLIRAEDKLWTVLAERYQTITGEPLQGFEQLNVKVSVFHADVMPGSLNEAAQRCGQRRCAQALLFTTDQTLLELMPIVDLSQGRVVQTLGEE
jgi:Cu2+-containing amine oxidase